MNTSEQARELWCPMVRIARREERYPGNKGAATVGGCNTDALGGTRVPSSCRCIAEDCAMWRWSAVSDPGWQPRMPPEWGTGLRPPERAPMVRANVGYCGLAGRPEVMG